MHYPSQIHIQPSNQATKMKLRNKKSTSNISSHQMKLRNKKTTSNNVQESNPINPQENHNHKDCSRMFVGVTQTKIGGFYPRIRNPIARKRRTLRNFKSVEEVSKVGLAKNMEFEKFANGKEGIEGVVCDEEIKKVVDQSDQVLEKQDPLIETIDSKMKRKIVGVDSRKTGISKNKIKVVGVDSKKKINFEGKVVGVSKAQSGKYTARIKHPVTKREIWIGTFRSVEEASMAYSKKKAELQNEMQGKVSSDLLGPVLEEINQNSTMEIEHMDFNNGESSLTMGNLPIQKNGKSPEKELSSIVYAESGTDILLKTESGMPIMDSHGFLLGIWSQIDDLSLPVVEDGN